VVLLRDAHTVERLEVAMKSRKGCLWISVALLAVLCLLAVLGYLAYYRLLPPLIIGRRDAARPTVTIFAPQHGDQVVTGSTLVVQAEGTARGSQVVLIQLWADGELVGEQNGAAERLNTSWSWLPLTPGDHTLTVRAYNQRGDSGVAMVRVTAIEAADSDGDGVADTDDFCPRQTGLQDLRGCPSVVQEGTALTVVWEPGREERGGPGPGGQEEPGPGPGGQEQPGPGPGGQEQPGPGPGEGEEEEEGEEAGDTDGDGVIGDADQCPNQPGPLENQGCPEAGDGDNGVDDSDFPSGAQLEVEMLSLRTAPDLSHVYCQVRLQNAPSWERVPAGQNEFFDRGEENGSWDLGGERKWSIAILEEEPLLLRMGVHCLGRRGGSLDPSLDLGTVFREHGPADWLGRTFTARSQEGDNWFDVRYRISIDPSTFDDLFPEGAFLEPDMGDVLLFEGEEYNDFDIVWHVPHEYVGQHYKVVFYFVDTNRMKWYVMDHNRDDYPFWLDTLLLDPVWEDFFDPSTDVIVGCNYMAGSAIWVQRGAPDGELARLPPGEYFAVAEVYNETGVMLGRWGSGLFTINEMPTFPAEELPIPVEEDTPLIIENISIPELSIPGNGINLTVAIEGRTRDGNPVGDYCNGGVCGGLMGLAFYSVEPGQFGGAYYETVRIPANRLKVDPNDPSRFGTMGDPLRVTVDYPYHPDYYFFEVRVSLDNSNEKRITYGNVPDFHVTSPTDGEALIAGTTKLLAWEKAAETGGEVRVSYSINDGRTWKPVGDAFAPFDWVVPYEFTESGQVKFEWYNVPIPPEEWIIPIKTETRHIKIRGIALVYPAGDEIFEPGKIYYITWTTSGSGGYVKLYYSEGSDSLIGCVPNTGRYGWGVPHYSTSYATIKAEWVTSCSGGNILGKDESRPFSIRAPMVRIFSPIFGEVIPSNVSVPVVWESVVPAGTPPTGNVALYYTTDDGDTWNTIADNLPIDGTYQFTVPSVTQNTQARLKAIWTHYAGDVRMTYTGETVFTIQTP